ncbi:MAG: DUF1398 family protein [Geminicoccaceae bacterium]
MKTVAETCLRGAETNSMTFPQIVGTLMQSGFESYSIDFRRASATYYLPDSDSVVLPTHLEDVPIAPALDVSAVRSAIRDAQALSPGYSYAGFCARVRRAGCAGYIVSLSGRRAVYFGRTAETHVELFPQDR